MFKIHRQLSNKMAVVRKKDMNRSCPDITEKNPSESNKIFTIKEEKEELGNTIKINEDKNKEQEKHLKQLASIKIRDKSINKSASKSVNKNPIKQRPASSTKERFNYNSNITMDKVRPHEDENLETKKIMKGRLSIPRGELPRSKIAPLSERKDDKKVNFKYR